MFKLFRPKKQYKIVDTKKIYIKPDINKLFETIKTNNYLILNIIKKIKLIDFCNFTVELEKYRDLGIKDINLRHIICDTHSIPGGNVLKQKSYIFKYNHKDYVISLSDDVIKISERELIDKHIYESTLDINYQTSEYCIGKYIHTDWHDTIYNKWYPSEFCTLEEDKAIETFNNLLNNLKEIPFINDIININNIYKFMNNNNDWNPNHKKFIK